MFMMTRTTTTIITTPGAPSRARAIAQTVMRPSESLWTVEGCREAEGSTGETTWFCGFLIYWVDARTIFAFIA